MDSRIGASPSCMVSLSDGVPFGSINTRVHSSLPRARARLLSDKYTRFQRTAHHTYHCLTYCSVRLAFPGDHLIFGLSQRSLMETEDASAHLLLALLPTTGMAAIALYIAVYMWKYGNDASIVVQSTVFNGWIFLFLGTLALLAGQVPPEVSPRRLRVVPRRRAEGREERTEKAGFVGECLRSRNHTCCAFCPLGLPSVENSTCTVLCCKQRDSKLNPWVLRSFLPWGCLAWEVYY